MAARNTDDVVSAATAVFLRYGFKRTTMGDLAAAAHMSRPALYLVFPSKEELFTAVMQRLLEHSLAEVRAGIPRLPTPRDQLVFAFDIWCVRPFDAMQSSPDARDLYESSYQFASEVMIRASDEFIAAVAAVLDPLVRAQANLELSATELARMLTSAIPGFKTVAQSKAQFRELISGMIAVVLASVASGKGAPKPSARPHHEPDGRPHHQPDSRPHDKPDNRPHHQPDNRPPKTITSCKTTPTPKPSKRGQRRPSRP
jgi:AcrR family transcriptional regulator